MRFFFRCQLKGGTFSTREDCHYPMWHFWVPAWTRTCVALGAQNCQWRIKQNLPDGIGAVYIFRLYSLPYRFILGTVRQIIPRKTVAIAKTWHASNCIWHRWRKKRRIIPGNGTRRKERYATVIPHDNSCQCQAQVCVNSSSTSCIDSNKNKTHAHTYLKKHAP